MQRIINTSIFLGTLLFAVACKKIDDSEVIVPVTDPSAAIIPGADDGTYIQADKHITALTTTDGSTQRTLYISLNEWSDLTSALNADGGAKAKLIAAQYTEGNITGWRLPTNGEVEAMKQIYDVTGDNSTALDNLNAEITAVPGGVAFINYADNGKAKRYLCANGDSTYNFLHTQTKPLKAGATVKYYMRLVKESVQNTNDDIDIDLDDDPGTEPGNEPDDTPIVTPEDKKDDDNTLPLEQDISDKKQL